jgi:hypothetical protein
MQRFMLQCTRSTWMLPNTCSLSCTSIPVGRCPSHNLCIMLSTKLAHLQTSCSMHACMQPTCFYNLILDSSATCAHSRLLKVITTVQSAAQDSGQTSAPTRVSLECSTSIAYSTSEICLVCRCIKLFVPTTVHMLVPSASLRTCF